MTRHKALTPQQRTQYDDDGYLFPLQVLSAQEVAHFRSGFEQVEAHLSGAGKSTKFPQLHLFFPWAYALITHPTILDYVEDILGPDILVHQTSIFSKRPHGSAYVSWHQDGDYWQLEQPDLVSAWVALTESTVENGCMRVVPGTHRQALAHAYPGLEANNMLPSGVQLEAEVDESQAVDVVLKPGEISLHHTNLVHGSGPNRSAGYRTGFAIRYLAPHVRQQRAHYQNVLVRGADRHGYYDLLESPPTGTFEACLAAYQTFNEQWPKKQYVLTQEAGGPSGSAMDGAQ